LKPKPFDIFWTKCDEKEVQDVERRMIGLFSVKYGAMPLCNSSIQRKKLKETYRKYQKIEKLGRTEKLLTEMDP